MDGVCHWRCVVSYFALQASQPRSVRGFAIFSPLLQPNPPWTQTCESGAAARRHGSAGPGSSVWELFFLCSLIEMPRRRRREATLWRSQPFGASPFYCLAYTCCACCVIQAYHLPSRSALTRAEVPAGRGFWGSWQEAICEKLPTPDAASPGLEACPCLSVRPRCVCSCLNTCRLAVLCRAQAASLCCVDTCTSICTCTIHCLGTFLRAL